MAKKKKREERSDDAAPAGPFNAAFAGLAALKADLPETASSPPEGSSADPSPPPSGKAWTRRKLVVRKEKKGRGGKTVTCVEGFEADVASAFATRMAKAMGCGASVEEGVVILQGHQSERVAEWLRAEGARQVVIGS